MKYLNCELLNSIVSQIHDIHFYLALNNIPLKNWKTNNDLIMLYYDLIVELKQKKEISKKISRKESVFFGGFLLRRGGRCLIDEILRNSIIEINFEEKTNEELVEILLKMKNDKFKNCKKNFKNLN